MIHQNGATNRSTSNSKTVSVSAKDINEAHRLAQSSARTAKEQAILCGELLLAQGEYLGPRGGLQAWVEKKADMGWSTAQRYMKAAKMHAEGVEFDSLRHCFPSGKQPRLDQATRPTAVGPNFETTAEKAPFLPPDPPTSAPEKEAPPESHKTNAEVGVSAVILGMAEEYASEPERPEWSPEEDAALESASAEMMASAERALGTDAMTEIKRLTAELAAVKLSRDGFMNGKAVMTNMLKAEQNKSARLEKKLQAAEAELESLRERIAMMEDA